MAVKKFDDLEQIDDPKKYKTEYLPYINKAVRTASAKDGGSSTRVDYQVLKEKKLGKERKPFFILDMKGKLQALEPKSDFASGECEVFEGPDGPTVVVKTANGMSVQQAEKLVGEVAKDAGKVFQMRELKIHLVESSYEQHAEQSSVLDDQVTLADFKKEWSRQWESSARDLSSKSAAQFVQWKADFDKFKAAWGFDDDGKMPVAIWNALLEGLSGEGAKEFQKYYDEAAKDYEVGQTVKVQVNEKIAGAHETVRTKALELAVKDLETYMAHASKYMDKLTSTVKPGTTWAFWSGAGAKAAALKNKSTSFIVLEGTIGDWFNTVWQFEDLTGLSTNYQLWVAQSELYATKASEVYKSLDFVGFIGKGGEDALTTWNTVEKPALLKGMKGATPSIEWRVVDDVRDLAATGGTWGDRGAQWEVVATFTGDAGRTQAEEYVKNSLRG